MKPVMKLRVIKLNSLSAGQKHVYDLQLFVIKFGYFVDFLCFKGEDLLVEPDR